MLSVLILLAGVTFFRQLSLMKPAPEQKEPQPVVLRVQTYRVESAVVDRFLASFGTAQPDLEVTISAEVAGRITEKVGVKVGDQVRGPDIVTLPTGESSRTTPQLLVQIDPQTYHERVLQVEALLEQNAVSLKKLEEEAALNSALLEQQESRLATITEDYERVLDLFARQAENESTVRQKKLEMEQYRETLIRLKNQQKLLPIQRAELLSQRTTYESDLRLAQLEFEKAAVRVPFSGTLSGDFVELGQYVRPGDPIARITATERMEVPLALTLSEAAILQQQLTAGVYPLAQLARREADIELPEGEIWHGEIRRVDPVASEQTRTVRAFVEVDNSRQRHPLRPGTFVHARVAVGEIDATQGLLIPRDALVEDAVFVAVPSAEIPSSKQPQPTEESFGIRQHQQAQRRPVVIRETLQSFALITSGLEPGEEIVMTNLDIIAEGTLLEIPETRSLRQELERARIPYLKPTAEEPAFRALTD